MDTKPNRLYGIFKGETQISDHLCTECLADELKDEPITAGERVEEVTPYWDERYVCAHCGQNFADVYVEEA